MYEVHLANKKKLSYIVLGLMIKKIIFKFYLVIKKGDFKKVFQPHKLIIIILTVL